jgi:CoA:oxalate CoA-transferase
LSGADADQQEIWMSLPETQAKQAQAPDGPLTGITVLDLTRVLAGPYCTMILADLGARVIKVEQPGTGDDSRAFGPFLKGQSAYFGSLNRGKESIALNLKDDDDKAIFHKLLSLSDILVENFRPGTMEKLGLGWDRLHADYPRLIYAAASGFGHTGPYSKRAAYDMVVQAMGGIMSVTGHPGQPPVRVGTSIGDITAGLFTAVGVNAALYHRALTGEAIKVDVGMLDCQVAILENAIARYAATGEVAGPLGARHPSITPFAAFHAKDGWIIVAAGNDALFQKMADAIGAPELAKDPRYTTNGLRTEHWEPLAAEINAALGSRTIDEWLTILDNAGVPSGAINTIDKVLNDPHVRSRNMVVTASNPEHGSLLMAGNPIKLSGFSDPETRRPAPELDADRAALLSEIETREAVPATLAPAPSDNVMSRASRSALRLIDQLRRAVVRDAEPLTAIGSEGTSIQRATALCDALLSERGEVLGTVIAHDLIHLIRSFGGAERFEFLNLLAMRYAPDEKAIARAADRWRANPVPETLAKLSAAVEAPRQELFRRMNMAPEGMATLLKLREYLLEQLAENPELQSVNADLLHLLGSWFNRGFLELQRIDWNTPAAILEKLIEYEAVHAIDGWTDLRRRLAEDRRCFAFFHPALPDEPLIFVEVALLDTIADKIEPIIRAPIESGSKLTADTAIFYSISNCQPGLRGVSFGNLLIKQVVADLAAELPELKTFATLSPMPRFRTWLENPRTDLAAHLPPVLAEQIMQETGKETPGEAILSLATEAESEGYSRAALLQSALLRLGARYLAGAGSERGPSDPVARFHLGNGARIERIDWMADLSQKGLHESFGLMVNYLYDLRQIEVNHEAFANRKPVAVSREVAELIDISEGSVLSRSLKGPVDAALSLWGRKF